MKSKQLVYWIAVAAIAAPGAASAGLFAAANKLSPRIAVIARAAADHKIEPLMAPALTRQLFGLSSPFDARWNALGEVQVYLHYRDNNPPNAAELAALGATGIILSPELGVVQAWVPADKLANAAALGTVTRVSVPRYALMRRAPTMGALPRTGSVDSQGDQILGAAAFRSATGYNGQGMVVGVISNGDSGVSTDQGTGDLPSNVWNDPNNTKWGNTGAEGTAMMEVVYDLAPGVKELGFASPSTTVEFLTALNDFSSDINANIVVDDLGFPGEAMFTNGTFANGVQQFATAHPNVHLVTAAGNDGAAFWSGSWTPYTLPSPVTINGVTYTQALNFGTAGNPNPLLQIQDAQPGDALSYVVEWNDPWLDSSTTNDPNDYDVVMFNSSSMSDSTAIACNQGINIGPAAPATSGCKQTNSQPTNTPGPLPVQGSGATLASNESAAYLAVFYVGDSSPGTRVFKILAFSSNSNQITVTPTTDGSIYGQSAVGNAEPSTATPGEITVGAVQPTSPYDIEPYSSLGLVQFGIPGIGPGTQTSETIQKPDFVAPDCVSVTGVGGFGSPFCGTSAAAPHIAGLIALLLSAYTSSDDPYMLLQQSASHLMDSSGLYPNGTFGYGMPNLQTLLASGVYPKTGAEITAPISGTSVASGQSVTFEGQCLGYDGSSHFNYLWDFGSSAVPTSTSPSPTVTYNTAGTYTVTLTCTNKVGSGSATSSITVTASRFGGGGGLGWLTLVVLLLLQVVATRRNAAV